MVQEIICRPILLRDIAIPRFLLWRRFKNNYSMDFHGRVTKFLEMYSVTDARVGNIKRKILNNFKIQKTTFNCLILIIFVIFVVFRILKLFKNFFQYFQLLHP